MKGPQDTDLLSTESMEKSPPSAGRPASPEPSSPEPLDHDFIERHDVVGLYVTGRLSQDDVARFEEHYLDCPECIAEIQAAERLQRGLSRAVAQDAAKVGLGQMIARALGRPGMAWIMVAALLAVAAGLPTLWMQGRVASLEERLIQAHVDRSLALQPGINTPVIELGPMRGSGSSTYSLSLPPTPGWLVLASTVEPKSETYEAILTTTKDRKIWQADGLQPDPAGKIHISFHSSQFEPGVYHLELITTPAESGTGSTRYRLEILEDAAGP